VNKIRLYIDEDASRKSFIFALRDLGLDLVTTSEAVNLGLDDSEQLIWATNHNRAIYTFNVRDYCRLHKTYMSESKQHFGIIVVPRQSYSVGEQLRGLQKLISSMSLEEMKNQLIFLGVYI
jgi:DNA-binding transcriptional MerR regulator